MTKNGSFHVSNYCSNSDDDMFRAHKFSRLASQKVFENHLPKIILSNLLAKNNRIISHHHHTHDNAFSCSKKSLLKIEF